MWITNLAGLFELILQSRKPEALRFTRWVTHDVLPSIIETGGYVLPGKEEDFLAILEAKIAAEFEIDRKRMSQIEQEQRQVKQSVSIGDGLLFDARMMLRHAARANRRLDRLEQRVH